MVRCWSMTEEDSMRGVLVRAKRKESKKERRKEKRENIFEKKISSSLLLSLLVFWKDQNERPPPLFFCKKKKEKKSHSKPRKKKEKNHNKIYSSRASRNVKAASSAEKKTPTRRIHKARSSSVLMIGFYIAPLRDFYCADRTRIFSLFVFEGREENLSSRALSLSLVWKPPAKTRGKEKKWKWEKNSSKKNIIKNVAARALRKTSVLSFRVHHARDIFVMNRWRSSVFFIWTRMYLYITVYPPLLFCLCFFSSSSSCFFGTLARGGFCLFDQKKRKKEKSFFLRFSSFLSFLVLSGALKETKKESSLFFLLLSDANKQTNANASLRLKSTTGGRVQKDDARLKKVLFLFCCVVLCLFLIRMLFRFERRERKGNHQKSQKGKKKFSRSKKFGFLFFFFLFQKRAAKERRRGYKINSGSCRKLLSHSIIIIGQFKFQLAS